MKLFDEPKLLFGYNQEAVDPRDGLILFGPHEKFSSYNVRYGVIGTEEGIKYYQDFVSRINRPILSTKRTKRGIVVSEDRKRPSYPGFEPIYQIGFPEKPEMTIEISKQEIAKSLSQRNKKIRTSNTVDVFLNAIVNASNKEDVSVDIWFIILPWMIYTKCNTSSFGKDNLSASGNFIKQSTEHKQGVMDFFDFQEYLQEAERYLEASSDFHHLLKARLIQEKVKVPVQIMVENTVRFRDKEKNRLYEEYMKAHLAWTQSTTVYYKLGKLPWKLSDIRDGVCYLGLVYKKIKGEKKEQSNICSAAQMFLKDGDGSVFRGNIGLWESRKNEFHLDKPSAKKLIGMALDDYHEKWDKYPSELFIHAKTLFDDIEWEGFLEALSDRSAIETKLVGITIKNTNPIKLYRHAENQDSYYGILRGMGLIISDQEAYLATRGFIPRLNTANCLEIPRMLHVKINKGEADIETVVKDILALTKLNYNACIYGDGVPVTLKFSEKIGSILTATDKWEVDVRQFKFYI